MDAKRALVRNWLKKARRGLLSAKRLTRGNDPYFDTAIYHCQQCAEKAIKVGWFIKTSHLKRPMIYACW
jgi:HEPN domain-containing protein